MLIRLLRLFAKLPLSVNHFLGVFVGWAMYWLSPSYAGRLRENLYASGIAQNTKNYEHVLSQNVAETGKAITEAFAIWFRPQQEVLNWVHACKGWQHVEDALTAKCGIIFLTPHLGCFEITAQYYASHHPISVLYRPPRKAWLEPIIQAGRARSQIKLAPTNLQGVRSLLKALKQGEAIGILPDQVPSAGEGEWQDFFGRPAYTMTLVNRLAQSTGAVVLLAFGERLTRGEGYVIHISPLAVEKVAAGLNSAIEDLVRTRPEQYLWAYNRYKTPKGVVARDKIEA